MGYLLLRRKVYLLSYAFHPLKKMTVYDPEDPSGTSINSHLIASGMGRTAKKQDLDIMISRMADANKALEYLADLTVKQEEARKGRNGMWRYGDVGEDDEEL